MVGGGWGHGYMPFSGKERDMADNIARGVYTTADSRDARLRMDAPWSHGGHLEELNDVYVQFMHIWLRGRCLYDTTTVPRYVYI